MKVQYGSCAGDAIRPFLLHAYGGLYMDVDVECFDATDKMIDGFDLVLQLEDSGNKSLNNAVMAGAPGLEIWSIMHGLLQQRCARRCNLWQKMPKRAVDYDFVLLQIRMKFAISVLMLS